MTFNRAGEKRGGGGAETVTVMQEFRSAFQIDLENKGCEEELNALGLFQSKEPTQQVSAMKRTAEKKKQITCPPSAVGRGQ